ncbi:MAG: hypothetical protein HYR68_06960 [Burkholderiales bacterium]|nr:hypothetical protein [Burkholderiales bacterium]
MHKQLKQMRRLAGAATMTGVSLFCHAALAQEAKVKDAPQVPPLANQIAERDVAADLIKPAANLLSGEQRKMVERSGREIRYFLPIQMTPGFIYNPSTAEYDQVSLRSYGRNVSGAPNLFRPDFVAPTVVMKPGQTVRFDLSNRLDKILNTNTMCRGITRLVLSGTTLTCMAQLPYKLVAAWPVP